MSNGSFAGLPRLLLNDLQNGLSEDESVAKEVQS